MQRVGLQLHGAIYRPDSFVLMLRYCANLKAIRYESTSFNRIAANISHSVIAALVNLILRQCKDVNDPVFKRFVSMPILKEELPSSLKTLKHVDIAG